jgi:hypothetical protein
MGRSLRQGIAGFVLGLCIGIPSGFAQLRGGAPTTNTQEFTDPTYGYSIRIPASWKSYRRDAPGEPQQRLSLVTPNRNVLIVSVYRLPRPVKGQVDFEYVGSSHVDAIVKTYRSSHGLTEVVGEKKDNQSDSRSLRFWQGTSAFHESMAPAMLISLHTVSFGSDVMVNIVYVSGNDSTEEVKAVDALMNSLSFARR